MALADELDAALGEMLDFAGETVTIHDLSNDATWEGTALVTGGAGGFEDVPGGYFTPVSYTVTVRKSDVAAFVPTPGMLIEARARDLRIAENGVTTDRARYRLTCVDRDA